MNTKQEEFFGRKLMSLPSGVSITRMNSSDYNEPIERSAPAHHNDRHRAQSQTHAESYYYQKQIQGKIPLAFVLRDGQEVRGLIEWYDTNCLKIHRDNGSSLLVYKAAIRYLYKISELDCSSS